MENRFGASARLIISPTKFRRAAVADLSEPLSSGGWSWFGEQRVSAEDSVGLFVLRQVINFGHVVIMPGLIDVHAHLDNPGRVEWGGLPSGIRAADAGGITTVIDIPLNSAPFTVSIQRI
ncbi:putative allantoinase [Drosera capensis]